MENKPPNRPPSCLFFLRFIFFSAAILLFGVRSEIAFAADRLGDAKNVSGKTTVLILEPQIYAGKPAFDEKPLSNQSLLKPVYERAISEAAKNAFRDRGYKVISFDEIKEKTTAPDFQQACRSAWQVIIQNTQSRKIRSDKTEIFNISPHHNTLRVIDRDIDLFVFTQIYLGFSPEEISQLEDLAVDASGAAATLAVEAFVLRSPLLLLPKSDTIYCKNSFFDPKTGELIWYRSSEAYPKDLRNKKFVADVLTKLYQRNIPQALNPYQENISKSKFKKTRSELSRKSENETTQVVTQ